VNAKLGLAIIGTGTVAERHVAAMKELDGAGLVAVYDADGDRCRAFADTYGGRPEDSLEALLARGDVDIVTIATPSGLHAEVAVPAARAGKHVICEKPLETTVEKVDQIISACAQNNVLLSAVFQSRFGDSVGRIRDALDRGRFGRLVLASAQVRWYRSREYYATAGWRGTWRLDGGGALMNQSIHIVDLLLHLAGDVSELHAYADTITHPGLEVEDTVCAALRFRCGALGVIEASTSCAPGFPRRLEISGEAGSVVLEDDRIGRWEFVEEEPADAKIRAEGAVSEGLHSASSDPRAGGHEGHRRQFQDMVDAIREEREPAIPGSEGRRAVELITGIYQSAQTGRPYRFEPAATSGSGQGR
jgi:predicted dehydrogenase